MIVSIIMAYTALIVLLSLYLTKRTGAKANGNILMGITMPYEALKKPAVSIIIKNYQRVCSLFVLAFIVLYIPCFLLNSYISVMLIYFIVWGIACFYVSQRIFNKYHDELLLLKRENNWWVGEQHIISVDTEVSRLKDTFPLSWLWFIFPLLISIIPFIILLVNDNRPIFSWIIAFSGFAIFIITFYLSYIYKKDKTVAYSDDSEINLVLNRIYKREWSKCWILIAITETSLTTALFFIMPVIEFNEFVITIYALLSSAFIIISIMSTYNRIQNERNSLLQTANEIVYTDDDQFWYRDSYCNPNDNRLWVNKRLGYGMTINMAKKGARLYIPATLGITVLIFVGLAIYLIPLDFGSVSLTISEQTAKIAIPLKNSSYSHYDFAIEDIKQIKIIDEFPNSSKIYGANGTQIYAGRFNVSGYGASHVYIHHNNSPFIAVELENSWLFMNGRTKEQTEMYLEKLKDR